MSKLSQSIDIYCERVDPGLWAEPLNAITNLAFYAATFFAFRLAQKNQQLKPGILLLLFFLFAIGTGSGLFHTFATRWAELTDVIPILIFQICFLILYCQKVLLLNLLNTAIALCSFFVLVYLSGLKPSLFNGSIQYLPAITCLLVLAAIHWKKLKNSPLILFNASFVFCLSLSFRSIDMKICSLIPFGTHFLWHLLNALVLFLCIKALILNYQRN